MDPSQADALVLAHQERSGANLGHTASTCAALVPVAAVMKTAAHRLTGASRAFVPEAGLAAL